MRRIDFEELNKLCELVLELDSESVELIAIYCNAILKSRKENNND